jgi:hypothetical protein
VRGETRRRSATSRTVSRSGRFLRSSLVCTIVVVIISIARVSVNRIGFDEVDVVLSTMFVLICLIRRYIDAYILCEHSRKILKVLKYIRRCMTLHVGGQENEDMWKTIRQRMIKIIFYSNNKI